MATQTKTGKRPVAKAAKSELKPQFTQKRNGKKTGEKTTTDTGHASGQFKNKLYRSETNKMLGGVSGGLADYFNLDVTLIRLIFVLLVIFGGSGVLVYLVLWLVIPSEKMISQTTDATLKANTDEIRERAQHFADDLRENSNRQSSRHIFGAVILVLGIIIFLSNFGWFNFFKLERFWPVILIIIGFAILTRNDESK